MREDVVISSRLLSPERTRFQVSMPVINHSLLFGYCNLVIDDYLDIGIWLLISLIKAGRIG